ncbi:hypothetical protein YB2330_004031 [Saitoella coloradoensis]
MTSRLPEWLPSLLPYPAIAISAIILLTTRKSTYAPRKLKRAEKEGDPAPGTYYVTSVHRALIALCTAIGVLSSGFWAGARMSYHDHAGVAVAGWLTFVSWVFVAALVSLLAGTRRPGQAFWYVVHLAVVSGFVVGGSGWGLHDALLRQYFLGEDKLTELDVALSSILFTASAILFGVTLVFPRGPRLVFDGKMVDGAVHASLWSFLTFSWTKEINDRAVRENRLEVEDLGSQRATFRAQNLHRHFAESDGKDWHLLRRIIVTFKWQFILQWSMGLVSSVLQYAPTFFLLRILQFVQMYKAGEVEWWYGWYYVAGMCAAKLAYAILYAQVWYISACVLQTKVNSVLNTAIFAKTLKRKDIVGVDVNTETKNDEEDDENSKKDKKGDEEVGGSRQNVLNLMAVDADRVATYSTWDWMLADAPLQIAVAIFFLYNLLGWSTFVGFSVMIVLLPINQWASKSYSSSQSNLMKIRDRRVGIMTEILQGIRQLKFMAWERNWEAKVNEVRDEEVRELRRVWFLDVCFNLIWSGSPILVTVSAFFSYTKLQEQDLTPALAFTTLSVFKELGFALNIIPEAVVEALQAWTSLKRIQRFLHSAEIEDAPVGDKKLIDDTSSVSDPERFWAAHEPIVVKDATITWPSDNALESVTDATPTFSLKDINAEFPRGALSLIFGHTGAGKTLMLLGLLGEADVTDGSVSLPPADSNAFEHGEDPIAPAKWIIPGAKAYVPQTAWLLNDSIRSNILFGLPYDEKRYDAVVNACALTRDLEILEDGDLTEIGAKGLNISGGQKARVSLARAVYSRAEILICDDVLSALDAHVSSHIVNKCLMGPLMRERTRILVTHHVKLCMNGADYIMALSGGRIEHAGYLAELKRTGSLQHILDEEEDEEIERDAVPRDKADAHEIDGDPEEMTKSVDLGKKPKKFVEEEARERGAVKTQVYSSYFLANGGVLFWCMIIGAFIMAQGLEVAESYWLRLWSSSYKGKTAAMLVKRAMGSMSSQQFAFHTFKGATEEHSVEYYLGVYVAIAVVSILMGLVRFAITFYGSIQASRVMYRRLLHTVLYAPMRWLDTTPVGRVLNRFSKDFETIDSKVANDNAWLAINTLGTISVTVVCIFVTPTFLIAALLLCMFAVFIGRVYMRASRELKRLDSVSKSPIFELFQATISGTSVIRAYGASQRFLRTSFEKMNILVHVQYNLWLVNRWMSVRFNVLGGFFATIAAALILININRVDAGLAGFSLSFALDFQTYIFWMVRRITDVELSMNAVERVTEYTNMPTEPQDQRSPPATWPENGAISFRNYEAKYAADLPLVLRGLTFDIKSNEKICLVGRTGSGKSTITLGLFRFLEAAGGDIFIDGVNISKISLYDLRSRLTIIPQDPVLFTGTVRSNLDAFNEYSDAELYDALRRVQLIGDAGSETEDGNVFEDLSSPISEGGLNLSQGQRQLVALARALLRRSKIVIMDEATASIDFQTDTIIQRTIREELRDSTVIAIAHRLSVKHDKVMVLDHGKLLEFDTPANLLSDSESSFYDLCKKAGEVENFKRELCIN